MSSGTLRKALLGIAVALGVCAQEALIEGVTLHEAKFDDSLEDPWLRDMRTMLHRYDKALKSFDPAPLSADQRISHAVLRYEVDTALRLYGGDLYVTARMLPINQFMGQHTAFALDQSGSGSYPFKTVADYAGSRRACTAAVAEPFRTRARTQRILASDRPVAGELHRRRANSAHAGLRTQDRWRHRTRVSVNEMLRANRLVIDTGIHEMGWTSEQGIAWMTAHSSMDQPQAAAEVERYVAYPAQAVSYKIGQLEISRLRDQASHALGPRFDLRRFRDQVLLGGSLPLVVLDQKIERWIEAQQATN